MKSTIKKGGAVDKGLDGFYLFVKRLGQIGGGLVALLFAAEALRRLINLIIMAF